MHNAEHSGDLGVAPKEPRKGRPAATGRVLLRLVKLRTPPQHEIGARERTRTSLRFSWLGKYSVTDNLSSGLEVSHHGLAETPPRTIRMISRMNFP